MIVLDTNVLSEPLRPQPDVLVMRWLAANPDAILTAVSVGEILTGVARMPDGARRDRLTLSVSLALEGIAEVLPYDETAARFFAEIQELRRKAGRPLSTEDGMIAAICVSHRAQLATRNVRDFTGLGIDLVNPWEPVDNPR